MILESQSVPLQPDATEVLLVSPWLEPVNVSPTFQILREELSHVARPVTRARLASMLPPEEVDRYADLFRYAGRIPVSLGMLSIAACLNQNGFPTGYLPLQVAREDLENAEGWLERTLEKALAAPELRVIGFGALTNEIPLVERACRVVRKLRPGLPIVLGGPHVTFRPLDLLCDGLVDIVVRSEGEMPMLRIVERVRAGADPAGIPSTTILRDGGPVSFAGDGPADLATLPMPRYDLAGTGDRGIYYGMYTRSCPNRCAHCVDGRLFPGALRSYPPARLLDSLELLANQTGWRFIHLADSSFGASRETAEALCDELERRPARFLFSVNARPDLHRTLGADLIRRLRAAGFIEFLIGAESGSDRILKSQGRGHNVEDLITTLTMLRDCGVPLASTYWMVGLPFEDIDDVADTIRLQRRLLDEDLTHFATSKPFIPVPGTSPFEHPEAWGIEIVSMDWSLYARYGQPLPYRHSRLSAAEIESAVLLMQSIMVGSFQRRAGERKYDLAGLRARMEASYERAVYL